MEILVGADPELFMFKDGVPISAHGMIPGDKYKPFPVPCGAVQVDGMALEFNINPAKNAEEFSDNLEAVMNHLRSMVPDYSVMAIPVAEFGHEYIKAQPREALELGCNPDYNAWKGGAVNEKPNVDNPFRTGAGHVHVGWTSDADVTDRRHFNAGIMLTKQLDYFLGLPSLLFDHDTKRRTMYGAPGAFRPKPYGCEYRVLSNAWLKDRKLMQWVFNNTVNAVERLMGGFRAYDEFPEAIRLMSKKKPDHSQLIYYLKHLGIKLPPVVEA